MSEDSDNSKESVRSVIELTSDGWGVASNVYGWQIVKKVKTKVGYQWQSRWYYNSLTEAVSSLIKKKTWSSDYSSIEELANNLGNIKKEVLDALKAHGVENL